MEPITPGQAAMSQNTGVTHFAQNPGQDLTLRFQRGGARIGSGLAGSTWQVTMRLKGAGDTAPRVDSARVEYGHGGDVTEWWDNRPDGIEHGFTLGLTHKMKRRDNEVLLPVIVDGLKVRARGDDLRFVDEGGREVLAYRDLKAWDALGRELPARMRATDSGLELAFEDGGAAYPVTIDPLITTLERKLEATTGTQVGLFGSSVALSGNTALIGASEDDTAEGQDVGGAYVFVLIEGTWRQHAKLAAPEGEPFDYLGRSVALDGDTALVSMHGEDSGVGSESGAVLVFVRSGSTWMQQAKLETADGAAGDLFGFPVAMDGDTALAGAHWADTPAGSEAGAAYVFVRSGSNWTQQAKLEAGDGAAGDLFGFSTSLDGDTALVGAHSGDTAAGGDAGAAYVFSRTGSNWMQQAKLTASDGAAADWFGYSVAIDGDTAVAGARLHDTAGRTDAGAAYAFVRNGTNWTQQAKLVASDGAMDDYFGFSADLEGDTALIGAFRDGGLQGSAYAFVRTGDTWGQQAKLIADDGGPGDYFGHSVCLDGDRAIVGALREDVRSFRDLGSAYVFARVGGVWSQQAKITPQGARFGFSVDLHEDTALIGAYRDDSAAGAEVGRAHVFVRDGTNWQEQARLGADDGAADDRFGYSVALHEDTALVGAYHNDPPAGTQAGAAYVFSRTGTNWNQQMKLASDDLMAGDRFGRSVAVDGDTALVGAYYCDTAGGANAGAVYVFARAGGSWDQEAKLVASDGAAGDYFGVSVSLDGSTALVGSYLADGAGASTGAAYVFARVSGNWSQRAKLVASDGTGGDYFGFSLELDADTALVGAYNDNVAAGSAYVFVRSGETWSQQAKLTADSPSYDGHFGYSVALAGNTALVGAGGQNTAYMFSRIGTNWYQEPNLQPPYGDGDYFGGAVAVDGNTALIGAYMTDTLWGGLYGGCVYVFRFTLPEIAIEHPEGVEVADGGPGPFIATGTGGTTNLTFTIRNLGTADLLGLGVTIDGSDATAFTVTENPAAVVPPSSNTTFSIRFSPADVGPMMAAMHVTSNDADENPYDIHLTGKGLTALETWRQQHFGTYENTGDAANSADPEWDGIPNLIEFGTGCHPLHRSAGQLPACTMGEGTLRIRLTEPSGVDGIVYGAEYSTDLRNWMPVSDSGSGTEHDFSISVGANSQMFLRLTIAEE